MGHQKHARIFFIYRMLCCSEFVRSLDQNHKRGSSYDRTFYMEYAQMLEHSLGFYEWSMKREHEPHTIVGEDGTPETSVAQKGIRRYLGKVKRCCLRTEMGKSYKMPKFHQSLHLVSAVESHGSLMNVDGSRPESMAKGNVKDPTSHTQQNSSKLSYQTGKRYMESLTFREYKHLRKETDPHCNFCCDDVTPYISNTTDKAKIALGVLPTNAIIMDADDQSVDTKGSTKFCICLDVYQPEGHYAVTLDWLGKGNKPLKSFDDHLLQQLGKRLLGALDGGIVAEPTVPGCTSINVNGNKYTAHPMFGNDHVWKDWVYIKWDGYDDEPIPAHIELFIDLTGSEILNENPEENHSEDNPRYIRHFDHEYLENKVYAVVWSAKSQAISRQKITDYHIPLNLAYRVELEAGRRIVPVEAFVKPCFGMLNSCGLEHQFDMTAIILKQREQWADFFLSP
jgi:hypothetical protein